VFDATKTKADEKADLDRFENCLEALRDLSDNAKIFCLVHKMDLLQENQRESIFQDKKNKIMELCGTDFGKRTEVFRTSIWDETLYKAWSQIVSILLPNIKQLEQSLSTFCQTVGANEAVIFERSTFLVISHHDSVNHEDVHRFEKISNIIKQFKLSCIKTNYQF